MRQSSFEKPVDDDAIGAVVDADTIKHNDRRDRIGARLVAISAFVCWYQRGNPPSGVNLESSWFDVLTRAFTQGWQWGSDIVFTYGPLGFLTPYLTWNPETASVFRIGQIVLCLLWAAMAFAFARRLGTLRQALLVIAMFAFYPLLVIDIGWNIPFVFAVVLIYRMVDEVPHRAHRTSWYISMIVLLSLLALIKFTGQVMWIGVMGYATLLGLLRRDFRTALTFGLGGPAIFLAIWLAIGQSISGLGAYFATSLNMSSGYGAMSLQPGPHMDAIGAATFAVLAAIILVGYWLSAARLAYVLAAIALLTMSLIVWKAGYVRPDDHVVIFYGSAFFITFAALCFPAERRTKLIALRWIGLAGLTIVCLTVSYRFLAFDWGIARMSGSLASLLHPGPSTADWAAHWNEQAAKVQLPRTQARVGQSKVDVLMNEQSIAILNHLNYQPRPGFQGYAAYTTELTRRNEVSILAPATAPEYLLSKLQSIDFRLPTGEDPLTVLAALRSYLPVDTEGGYLVMRRTGWPVKPIEAPDAAAWKVVTLGADIQMPDTPAPQILFFDVQLTAWGKFRSTFLREPNLRVEMQLNDGSKQSYLLIRRLGHAGMLISPFLLSEVDYLRWHASLGERRVTAMRLIAADLAEVRWFKPQVAYALQSVDLPRVRVDKLSDELQQALYPGFHPAPMKVESGRQEVVNEAGKDVLFTHAPATLTFDLGVGEWTASGSFGLLSSAYQCEVSDGIALVADRVDAAGNATRLFSRQINPVHNQAERGALQFSFGPFAMQAGDQMILRNETGLANDAKGDCDWMFLGPLDFERADTSREKN